MQAALLPAPQSEAVDRFLNRYHYVAAIVERLPSFPVFVRIALFIVVLTLSVGALEVNGDDHTVWLTLPYLLLILHMFNLVLGIFMGFTVRATQLYARNNQVWLVNETHDLESERAHDDSDSLFDLSQPSDYVPPGERLPKYEPFRLWKVKVLSTKLVLLCVSANLLFCASYRILTLFVDMEHLDKQGPVVFITPFITAWVEWLFTCEPWIQKLIPSIFIPLLLIFHVIPTILMENFLFHDNLYGCDFSIWPAVFFEEKLAWEMKDVEIIFPLHGLFLLLVSNRIGLYIQQLTNKKLSHFGDPYNRVIELVEVKDGQQPNEELQSLRDAHEGNPKHMRKRFSQVESQISQIDSGAETEGSQFQSQRMQHQNRNRFISKELSIISERRTEQERGLSIQTTQNRQSFGVHNKPLSPFSQYKDEQLAFQEE